jgi:hypothetical protein
MSAISPQQKKDPKKNKERKKGARIEKQKR